MSVIKEGKITTTVIVTPTNPLNMTDEGRKARLQQKSDEKKKLFLENHDFIAVGSWLTLEELQMLGVTAGNGEFRADHGETARGLLDETAKMLTRGFWYLEDTKDIEDLGEKKRIGASYGYGDIIQVL